MEDTIRLINVLIIKYRLECTLHIHRKNQYRIYIRQNSMPLLLNIVSPYMHTSMLYKLKSSLSKPSNHQQIEVTDLKAKTTINYDSMGKAARALNLPNYSIISMYFKNNQVKPYKGRYIFKKIQGFP